MRRYTLQLVCLPWLAVSARRTPWGLWYGCAECGWCVLSLGWLVVEFPY